MTDTDAIKEYIHDAVCAIKNGDLDVEDVAIPGGFNKQLDDYESDPAHVRGARYANTLFGTNYGPGTKPKRVYLERVHPDFFERMEAEHGFDPTTDPAYAEFKENPDVICFEHADQLPDEFVVDWDKMVEKAFQNPIQTVIEPLGVAWDEVETGQTQTGLEAFD